MINTIVFDLGGVVLDSPMDVIADAERAAGLEQGFFNRVASRAAGAWALHETGVLAREEFITQFEEECGQRGGRIDAGELLDAIETYAQARPRMVEAIRRLRAIGLRTAALTNNWESPAADWDVAGFQALFDVFVESWVEGVRKPDPAIYLRLLERLGAAAGECVFLDDIGRNLKTARELGMTTIKVTDPEAALAELGNLLGIEL
ncbi:MAG TPA: HAD family phosphatase [Acidimicrobiia bacterium]|nr:HAD family phosphatase [Acidimicrobiia bacterium]